MRHLLQANSPPSGVSLPSLSGGQAILYGIVVTAVIIVALLVTIRSLYLRVVGRRMNDQQAALTRVIFFNDPARRTPGAVGLDQRIVERFPTYSYSVKAVDAASTEAPEVQQDGGCIVCLEEYKEGDVMRRLPECSHAFHAACIDAWFTQHTTCPVCRVSLQPKDPDPDSTSDTPLQVAPSAEDASPALPATSTHHHESHPLVPLAP
eukprot:TRINITY_DN18500_c0_g1_i1.p1 TRINITY_DN18500_c0_g1~~TRINITY_DN18500_c0_g1_i1.p1  ORF type:complete len:207 (+),score=13.57 TRINITY_DN18500_c0_g1_i1:880-1500(+)